MKPDFEKIAMTVVKIILMPFVILSLWASLMVFKDVGKDLLTKHKRIKNIGIVISK